MFMTCSFGKLKILDGNIVRLNIENIIQFCICVYSPRKLYRPTGICRCVR